MRVPSGLLWCLLFCAAGAPPARGQSLQVVFNTSWSNLTAVQLNSTGVDTAILKGQLDALAASNPAFAGAIVGTVVDLLTFNLVSPTACAPGSRDPQCVCAAGTRKVYLPDGVSFMCPQCPPGGYSGFDSLVCTPCPAGTYQPGFGAASAAQCTPCGAGSRSPANASGCVPCLTDEYAPSGSSVCLVCAPGLTPTGDGSACSRCPNNHYEAVAGLCVACGVGQEANSDNTACVSCPAGTFYGSAGGCVSG
jgi:hypothetical protein